MTTQQTVGEIAAGTPSAVRVFEKYGIDYCCGGKRPLEDACRQRGVSAESVLAEVKSAATRTTARDWTSAPLAELIAHIVGTHHEYLRSEMPRLRRRLAKVIEVHGGKHPETLHPLGAVYAGLEEELDGHMRKEEMVLFPAIEQMEAAKVAGTAPFPLPFGTVNNPIRMMVYEHDNAGNALEEMRRVTGGYTLPEGACPTFRALYEGLRELEADLHQHIHLENNILFPRAIRLESELG
jgi:regulator of cell morphogenesis and NO signaling